jgi:hypothetical protein
MAASRGGLPLKNENEREETKGKKQSSEKQQTHFVMIWFVNSRQSTDSVSAKVDHACSSHVPHIGSDPSAMKQFEHVIGGFVIATDENGWYWCGGFSTIIAKEGVHLTISHGASHTRQIGFISNGLSITENSDEIRKQEQTKKREENKLESRRSTTGDLL